MYFLISSFATLFGLIPTAILEWLAKILGVGLFDILRLRRSLMLSNIKTAFPDLPDNEAIAMARRSMIHLVTTVFELLWTWRNVAATEVTVQNASFIGDALSQGRGVYVLCTHTGNFETFGFGLSRIFGRVMIPVKRVGSSKGLNRFVAEGRSRQGIEALARGKKGEAFIVIRKTLSENRIVGFMMDQARPGEPRINLFGKPAKTNTSLGAIWEKCPAPIVPGYCERIGFARHVVHLLPEIKFTSTGNLEQDVLSRAQACNTIVEEIIRRCPDQYWWVHDRWK